MEKIRLKIVRKGDLVIATMGKVSKVFILDRSSRAIEDGRQEADKPWNSPQRRQPKGVSIKNSRSRLLRKLRPKPTSEDRE